MDMLACKGNDNTAQQRERKVKEGETRTQSPGPRQTDPAAVMPS
jgi:hypothetical protein